MAHIPLSLTVDSDRSKKTWRSSVLSLVSSILIQASALSALALLPLFSMGALPEPKGMAPLPKYVPVVPIAKGAGARTEGRQTRPPSATRSVFKANNVVPARFSDEIPIEDWFSGAAPGVPDGVLAGVIDYTGGSEPATVEIETPLPDGPLVVGGDVAPPRKIHDVPPVYPPVAIAARVEGTVVLEAVIDSEGNVSNLRVIQSIALLDRAALDAVRQWKYEPTRLNGRPVPIVMAVTVSFVLKR